MKSNFYAKPLYRCTLLLISFLPLLVFSQGFEGYYRFPTVHGNTVVFSAEGDLWRVSLSGGLAQRLTTHPEEEQYPTISPDGKVIAFSASYEGPTEIYTIPITGGLTNRLTYETDPSVANTWTPDGKIVYATRAYSTLPDYQLVTIDINKKTKERIPLSQASEASFDASGKTVFFVRPGYHGNVTKRYKGGTARQIWKFTSGDTEATQITKEYAGESHHPMWYDHKVYFITDRDGIMNIWSIDEEGNDLKQLTDHSDFDVRTASIHQSNIVYNQGADIWHLDTDTGLREKIDIRLLSDMDQLREKWEENPKQYITSVNTDPKGEKIVITARGRLFIAPVKDGRFVSFTDNKDVRYRDAFFSADGNQIIALSDESGEFEFVSLPANGLGKEKQITKDGQVLRFEGVSSPDGKWVAYNDLDDHMFILNLANGESKRISTLQEGIGSFSWSPDSKWLSFVQTAENTMAQIHLYHIDSGDRFPLTTDRANSRFPAWSPNGKFIYFLSDRNFHTLVGSPWGSRQPEPYFDASEKIYYIPLQKQTHSPFRPDNELVNDRKQNGNDEKIDVVVKVDKEGISERIAEVPVKPGNYRGLAVNEQAIYVMTSETGVNAKTHLGVVKIGNEDVKMEIIVEDVQNFQMSKDRQKIYIRKDENHFMVAAGVKPIKELSESKIDLSDWRFKITPSEDWKQIFIDAWRMERDYFYDKNMHGVNWKSMRDKYFALIDRITTRDELSDLIGRFVGELAALHTSVRGGDMRSDNTNIQVANLGARFERDENEGGFRIEHIYKADPDYPDEKGPLDDPFLDVLVGDVITAVNGKPTLEVMDIGELLRNQVSKQVRLSVKRNSNVKDIIVKPIGNMYSLRYRDWEYSRRLKVEKESKNSIGYVHLQAMGRDDINQWYKEFYPVFDRPGLIVDVRNNRGGNIESFILEKLLRKAWMYFKGRRGKPYANMQYAYRGHIVILVNQSTASDGEAFAAGFKKLDMGTAIGTRTWGGEIWLGSENRLTDGGLARAPMTGVYDENGEWLIEGHGFEPDIEVDNLPHATFNGEDAQLNAAIRHLETLIAKDPRELPEPPPYPDKSFNNKE